MIRILPWALVCSFIPLEAQILLRSPLQEYADSDKKMVVRSETDGQLFDGKITSYPPDQVTYERKVEATSLASWYFPVTNTFRVRPSWATRWINEKKFDENIPRRLEEHEWFEHRPALDFSFVTAGGLELLAGYEAIYVPTSEGSTDSASFREESSFGELVTGRFRGGLMKRTSVFTGGLMFQSKAEKEQSVVRNASDGSQLDTTKVFYSPLEMNVYARSELGGSVVDIELSAIQASEGGPKAGDSGKAIYDDHLRVRAGCLIPLDKSTSSLHVGLSHRTLSYSDNAFVSVDTIPISTLHLKVISGSWNRHFFLGAMAGYGQDTQSLPEFNQKFEVLVIGGQAGLFTDL